MIWGTQMNIKSEENIEAFANLSDDAPQYAARLEKNINEFLDNKLADIKTQARETYLANQFISGE